MYLPKSKKIWSNLLVGSLLFAAVALPVFAADETVPAKVDYQGGPAVDVDLDGLTDKGEERVYGTDPQRADTDLDGFNDGIEAVGGTSPNESNEPLDWNMIERIYGKGLQAETPWAWYLARMAGFLGFGFLWLTIFLGLSIRNPLLKKLVEPIYSFDFHCFLASSAVFWGLLHGLSLLLDHKFKFTFADIFVPLHFTGKLVDTTFLSLGIIALYIMIVLTFSSYLKQKISQRVWRWTHFLNPLALIFVAVHGVQIGTDLKIEWIRQAFLASVWLLVLLYLSSLLFMVIGKIKQRYVKQEAHLDPGASGSGGNKPKRGAEDHRPV